MNESGASDLKNLRGYSPSRVCGCKSMLNWNRPSPIYIPLPLFSAGQQSWWLEKKNVGMLRKIGRWYDVSKHDQCSKNVQEFWSPHTPFEILARIFTTLLFFCPRHSNNNREKLDIAYYRDRVLEISMVLVLGACLLHEHIESLGVAGAASINQLINRWYIYPWEEVRQIYFCSERGRGAIEPLRKKLSFC